MFDTLNINVDKVVNESFIKWSILCQENVKNLLELITQLISNEGNTENKTMIIVIRVNQPFNRPGLALLSQLAKTFNAKSIIVILTTKNFDKFFIIWKIQESSKFYELEEIEQKNSNLNAKEFYEFFVDFLIDSLSINHSGVPHYYNPSSSIIPVGVQHLVGPQNFNLFQLAADLGEVKVIEFLINLEAFDDQPCSPINPQSLALRNGKFKALSVMIRMNFSYSLHLDINQCTNGVQRILKTSEELQEAIKLKNVSKIEDILDQNKNLKHFYNLSNESAIKVAIQHKSFKIYDILLSHGVRLGPHESLNEICLNLSESNKEQIRSINLKHIIGYQGHVLYRNSYLSHDSTNPQKEFKYIKKAYKTLSQLPSIAAILKVVEASKKFQIIFDFSKHSVVGMDPTANDRTNGLFYVTGIILIGAKGLMDPAREFDVLGCLAHQLCHFALNLAYENSAKPYHWNDRESKLKFSKITEICRMNRHKEELISFAFNYYQATLHAELIVRVPQLMVLHHKNPEKLEQVKDNFLELFQYFEHKVVPDLEKAVPMVREKASSNDKKKDKIIKILVFCLVAVVILLLLFAIL